MLDAHTHLGYRSDGCPFSMNMHCARLERPVRNKVPQVNLTTFVCKRQVEQCVDALLATFLEHDADALRTGNQYVVEYRKATLSREFLALLALFVGDSSALRVDAHPKWSRIRPRISQQKAVPGNFALGQHPNRPKNS